jgi:hypothetical protein
VRVFHDKFGYGTVTAQEGNKLEIEFETAGPKRVIDSFVKLAGTAQTPGRFQISPPAPGKPLHP